MYEQRHTYVDLIIWLDYTYNLFLVLLLNLCRFNSCPCLKPWWELACICWYLRCWFFEFLLFHSPIIFWSEANTPGLGHGNPPPNSPPLSPTPPPPHPHTQHCISMSCKETYFETGTTKCYTTITKTNFLFFFFMVIQTNLSLMDQIHILQNHLGLDIEDWSWVLKFAIT